MMFVIVTKGEEEEEKKKLSQKGLVEHANVALAQVRIQNFVP
jgi:hypothetical protein